MPSLTIYLSDGLLSDVESVSKLKGISISKVLAESFRNPDIPEKVIVNPSVDAKVVLGRLDKLEDKIDLLLGSPGLKRVEKEPTEDELREISDRAKRRNQVELDNSREELVRKKGESSAAWLIRKKAYAVKGAK